MRRQMTMSAPYDTTVFVMISVDLRGARGGAVMPGGLQFSRSDVDRLGAYVQDCVACLARFQQPITPCMRGPTIG